MLFDPGPIVPIDEQAFRQLVGPGEPGQLAAALSPLVAELYSHASELDVTHDNFAVAGELPPDVEDQEPLLLVLVESGGLVDDPELALDANIEAALGSGDVDIETLTRELAGEAALTPPPPPAPPEATQADIDAEEDQNPPALPDEPVQEAQ